MGADRRTNIFGLNSMERHISQFCLHLFCNHFNIHGTFPNWQKFGLFSIFVIVLIDWVQSQQNSGGGAIRSSGLQSQIWKSVSGRAWASSHLKHIKYDFPSLQFQGECKKTRVFVFKYIFSLETFGRKIIAIITWIHSELI